MLDTLHRSAPVSSSTPSASRRRRRGAVVVAALVATVVTAGAGIVVAGQGALPFPIASGSAATSADGAIADGESIGLDAAVPAIERLDPDLRDALTAAADAAARDGLPFEIVSGWRSAAYQQALLDQAVVTYGSEQAARQYVATPEQSSHVTGDAVDLGPLDLQFWLMQHGADYGLCQTYANERWHWELATTPGGTCPEMLADASAPRR